MIDLIILGSIFLGTLFAQAALIHTEKLEQYRIGITVSIIITVFSCLLSLPVLVIGTIKTLSNRT